ncbi:MAG: hypothetical protein BJ554DRAFT_1809 [Olpidium bornovanus]|uniref:Uncharacterized protein n=1 Tax=Olpidium bornovanus TaxID=278681 RepID=A0A8H8DH66_9FUNG|nr:MAG: hypothetical protein BJ554DRAFT_1809 [Olpidium bornovanus]
MARRKAPAVARGSRARSAELNGRRRREAAVAQTGKTRAGPRLKPARTLSSRACAAPAAEAACDPETAARRGVDFINRQTGRAVTQFQWRVYSLCKQIPKGKEPWPGCSFCRGRGSSRTNVGAPRLTEGMCAVPVFVIPKVKCRRTNLYPTR